MTTILLVDDSATARMFIKRCLEVCGYTEASVLEAENGKAALSTMRSHQVDLVICDLNMPQMNGEALLKWMQGSDLLKHIPLMFITSLNNPAKAKELTDLGAFSILSKPVRPLDLKDPLAQVFS